MSSNLNKKTFVLFISLSVNSLISAEDWSFRTDNPDAEPHNWLVHGRSYSEQRFSPLNKINTSNVQGLGLDWFLDLDTDRGLEGTPIVVDGIMYLSAAWNIVFAIDAKTGKELWRHDPKVSRAWVAAYSCCDAVSRGVAIWRDQVIAATLDGRLISLDRETGIPKWSILTIDPKKPYTITGAPRVLNDKIIIGNSGADYGVRGYVSAYEAMSGDLLWRFFTVPGDPLKAQVNKTLEMASKTWTGDEWRRTGGGGTAWNAFAFDSKLNLLYFGVGNGTPWSREFRSPDGGDNLFLSSIVALEADTGVYAWHYQTTPGDSWNFSAVESIILADIKIAGQQRQVLMQAPKNGFFYVLDRSNGELISAEKYIPLNWASHVDLKTGRPVEYPYARYKNEGRLILPGPSGGHSWHPMSFSPITGHAYFSALSIPGYYNHDRGYKFKPGFQNTGIEEGVIDFRAKDPQDKPFKGKLSTNLLAWDPVSQTEAWRVRNSALGGGTIATSGNLVFQGLASGDFIAYETDNGKALWKFSSDIAIMAGPITYEVDGEQYIAVLSGRGGGSGLVGGLMAERWGKILNENRVLAFKLGSTKKLPKQRMRRLEVNIPQSLLPQLKSNDSKIKGKNLYDKYCYMCHGLEAISGGVIPDLRYSSQQTYFDWIDIVLGGSKVNQGMRSFSEVINKSQALQIRNYIIHKAIELSD
ncbi:MAG: PQQ-dependent dehydrogenase, methanol/ethanol family [Pseudomonadota bacterium]|nr:PQQ-dependent dehydrogenase, methanol/ethanol family [Pseudomonadota bacterium]